MKKRSHLPVPVGPKVGTLRGLTPLTSPTPLSLSVYRLPTSQICLLASTVLDPQLVPVSNQDRYVARKSPGFAAAAASAAAIAAAAVAAAAAATVSVAASPKTRNNSVSREQLHLHGVGGGGLWWILCASYSFFSSTFAVSKKQPSLR